MTTLVNTSLEIIDSDKNKARIIRKGLDKSEMTSTVAINIWCINNHLLFPQIKKLIEDCNFFKIFYGGNEHNFENVVNSFDLQSRVDVIYAGTKFEITKHLVCGYWNWKLKFKA